LIFLLGRRSSFQISQGGTFFVLVLPTVAGGGGGEGACGSGFVVWPGGVAGFAACAGGVGCAFLDGAAGASPGFPGPGGPPGAGGAITAGAGSGAAGNAVVAFDWGGVLVT
jgi:hypothetical protein